MTIFEEMKRRLVGDTELDLFLVSLREHLIGGMLVRKGEGRRKERERKRGKEKEEESCVEARFGC